MPLLKAFAHKLGGLYVQRLCKAESENQKFTHHNERSIEYRFALQALGEHRPKEILDVGTGTTAWPHLLRNCGYVVTAIDNVRDYWPSGMVNRHWRVLDWDITEADQLPRKQFDAVLCISVLEHIERHREAVKNMLGLLRPGGLFVLTCPYTHVAYSPNVYRRPDALYGADLPYICQSYSHEQLKEWLSLGAVLEKQELWRLFSGPFWATGQRVPWERVESERSPHQLGCFRFRRS